MMCIFRRIVEANNEIDSVCRMFGSDEKILVG
jgi:hypothetical protein